MNKHKLYLLTVSSLLLMAGCTEDTLDEGRGQVPISLTATVEDNASSRAGTSLLNSFSSGDAILVYFPENVRIGSVTSASSTTYSYNGSAWTPATTPYFNTGANSCTAHAYYPSSVTNATVSFSVSQAQNDDAQYKASDLMYASTTINKSNPTGSLTFGHKMAKIIVNATAGEGVGSISGVYVIGGNKTVALSNDGTCTLGNTSDAVSASSPITMYSGSESLVHCAALIPPQTIGGDFLKVSTNEGDVIYSLGSKPFSSGQSYTLNITVEAASVGNTVTITNWTDTEAATVTPTGDLTIDPIAAVTYNGSPQTPLLTVKRGTTTLNPLSDYSVEYHSNTNAGIGIVIVLGQGSYEGKVATAKFTINKANPYVSPAPAMRSGLIYTGSAQSLVSAGSTTGGTLRYKLNDGSFGTGIPTATNANTNGYSVTYYVEGDANYNSTAEVIISPIPIQKATPVVVLAPTTVEMNLGSTGATRTVSRVFIDNDGSGTFSTGDYDITSQCSVTYTSGTASVATVGQTAGNVQPMSRGTTLITATVAASGNWTSASASYNVVVHSTEGTLDDYDDPNGSEWHD